MCVRACVLLPSESGVVRTGCEGDVFFPRPCCARRVVGLGRTSPEAAPCPISRDSSQSPQLTVAGQKTSTGANIPWIVLPGQ